MCTKWTLSYPFSTDSNSSHTEPGSALLQCFTSYPQCYTEDSEKKSNHWYLPHHGVDGKAENSTGISWAYCTAFGLFTYNQHKMALFRLKYAIIITVLLFYKPCVNVILMYLMKGEVDMWTPCAHLAQTQRAAALTFFGGSAKGNGVWSLLLKRTPTSVKSFWERIWFSGSFISRWIYLKLMSTPAALEDKEPVIPDMKCRVALNTMNEYL